MSDRFAALALLALCGCVAPTTELMVVVRSDLGPELRSVGVLVRRRGATVPIVNRTFLLRDNPLPGEVAIFARDPDDPRPVEVYVTAHLTDPAWDFTHETVTRFDRGAIRYLELFLASECRRLEVRQRCLPGTVCGEGGRCIPVERAALSSPPPDPLRDAAAGTDAMDASDGKSAADGADGAGSADALDATDATDATDAMDAPSRADSATDATDAMDAPSRADSATDASDAMDATDAMDAPSRADSAADADGSDARPRCDHPATPSELPPPTCGAGPAGPERCGDGVDNDCDDATDEGCPSRSCDGCEGALPPGCGELGLSGGAFLLGEEPGDGGEPTPLASPTQPVAVSAFRMDRHEVTVGRFRQFWAAGAPAPPAQGVRFPGALPGSFLSLARWAPLGITRWPVPEPATASGLPRCTWSRSPAGREDLPVNCVTWWTAMAFCVWDGGRLPTYAEWEYAARQRPGTDAAGAPLPVPRRYPWGNSPPRCDLAHGTECPGDFSGRPRPVTAAPAWLGLYDLAGNVAEWTGDHLVPFTHEGCWGGAPRRQDPVCVVPVFGTPGFRGGHFDSGEVYLRGAAREPTGAPGPDDISAATGFRCVRTPP
jgi:formylglycine-generating enzyme required for sulfatase activity